MGDLQVDLVRQWWECQMSEINRDYFPDKFATKLEILFPWCCCFRRRLLSLVSSCCCSRFCCCKLHLSFVICSFKNPRRLSILLRQPRSPNLIVGLTQFTDLYKFSAFGCLSIVLLKTLGYQYANADSVWDERSWTLESAKLWNSHSLF